MRAAKKMKLYGERLNRMLIKFNGCTNIFIIEAKCWRFYYGMKASMNWQTVLNKDKQKAIAWELSIEIAAIYQL